jgi:hypothetical protein
LVTFSPAQTPSPTPTPVAPEKTQAQKDLVLLAGLVARFFVRYLVDEFFSPGIVLDLRYLARQHLAGRSLTVLFKLANGGRRPPS